MTINTGDATFNDWARKNLVWLPDRGMGYFAVSTPPEQVYDDAYWDKYVAYATTPLGKALNAYRYAITRQYLYPGAVLCDVGIGAGQFLETVRSHSYEAYGIDVNPRGQAWLKARDWQLDPAAFVDAMTFWDVLEHVMCPESLLNRVRKTVLVSLPIFTGPDHVLSSRHFRPTEHRWYWTREGFIAWMAAQSFTCRYHATVESLLGREDIHTFVFVRAGGASWHY